MYKLDIYCVYDPWTKKSPHSSSLKPTVKLDQGYDENQAELRALLWLTYRPNDIVMVNPA